MAAFCLPASRSFCFLPAGRWRLQGRRRRQGLELHIQRREGGHAGAAEVRAGDLREFADSRGATKHYFSRDQFEADLKRIVAFYKDRGYPGRARDLVRRQAERGRRRRSSSRSTSTRESRSASSAWCSPVSTRCRHSIGRRSKSKLPLQGRSAARSRADAGQPRIGARRAQGPRLSLCVRQDLGGRRRQSPNKPSRVARRRSGSAVDASVRSKSSATPASATNVIRRQLDVSSRASFRQSALQESQRKLYSPELFEFANVEPVRSDEKPPEIPTRVTVTEGNIRR